MSQLALLRDIYARLGAGDVSAVLATLDTDVAWHGTEGNPHQPSGVPWHGPQAVLEVLFVKLGDEWQDFTVTPKRFYDAGERIVVEGRSTGTYRATGSPVVRATGWGLLVYHRDDDGVRRVARAAWGIDHPAP